MIARRSAACRRPALRLASAAAMALLLALAACGRETEPGDRRVADLLAEAPWAELRGESSTIDLGSPAGFAALGHGWSWAESSAGTTIVWGLGEGSGAEVFIARPRDLEIVFRAWPYPFAEGPPQAVTWRVNDVDLGTVELPGDWTEQRLALPAPVQVAGTNRIELRFRRAAEPREQGGRAERRRLAVAFDWIRFPGLADGVPRTREEPPRLELPFGSAATFHVESPARARLEIGGLRLGEGGAVEIAVAQDGAPERLAARLESDLVDLSVPLDNAAGPLRIRIAALGPAGAGGSGAQLTGPLAVHATPPAQVTPPASRRSAASPVRERPDIVLYSSDTLRADHLGAYGYERPTSPRIDVFAAEAVLFERCFAQSPWTLPSMASVLTGLGPRAHGAGQREGSRLPEAHVLLPEILRDAGYRTGAFIANGYLSPAFGLDQGFDRFAFDANEPTTAERMHANALAWLDEDPEAGPIFAWVHTIEPHDPYDPPPELRRRFAPGVTDPELSQQEFVPDVKIGARPNRPGLARDLEALYDGDVAFQDALFGDFLDALDERHRYRDAVVVFLSDHGEEFEEHGSWTHGHSLYQELLDVPCIVRLPRGRAAGLRVPVPVQQIDLMPTLLALAGVDDPPPLPGASLVPLIEGLELDLPLDPRLAQRGIFSFRDRRLASVVRGPFKLIQDLLPSGAVAASRLFDLEEDPGELADLAGERPVTAGHLASLIRRETHLQRLLLPTEEARPDEATRKQLKALGYVD